MRGVLGQKRQKKGWSIKDKRIDEGESSRGGKYGEQESLRKKKWSRKARGVIKKEQYNTGGRGGTNRKKKTKKYTVGLTKKVGFGGGGISQLWGGGVIS